LTGIVLLVLVMMMPALLSWGDRDISKAMASSPAVTIGVIVLVGALGAALMAWRHQPLWLAALCGGLCALGGNGALYLYSSWRSSLWKAEVVIVLIVGAIPAAILFGLLSRRATADRPE
jgi:hypothetical protein